MSDFLNTLLSTPSPTFKEGPISTLIETRLREQCPGSQIQKSGHSLIAGPKQSNHKPHVVLVGHSDVVPEFFSPYQKGDQLHGAGASDMKAGLACLIDFFCTHEPNQSPYQFSLIVYAQEEGTPLNDNGLYHLIRDYPDVFSQYELAIVAEPTDNEIQIGAVGSLHAQISVLGQTCHSARPWQGENALYKAIPLIQHIANFEPIEDNIGPVTFKEVLSITESQCEPGRTQIPGEWQANINYRFSPNKSNTQAEAFLNNFLNQSPRTPDKIKIKDIAYSGPIIQSELGDTIMNSLGQKITAKQAWTDVAQLSQHGIPAFNFGPGSPSQAHQKNEYVLLSQVSTYQDLLKKALIQD